MAHTRGFFFHFVFSFTLLCIRACDFSGLVLFILLILRIINCTNSVAGWNFSFFVIGVTFFTNKVHSC